MRDFFESILRPYGAFGARVESEQGAALSGLYYRPAALTNSIFDILPLVCSGRAKLFKRLLH